DEPTNDLDLPSLRILEEALSNFDGSVLVVSHDRYFLDRVCDQVVVFEAGGVFIQPGNYSYYLEKKKERDARVAEKAKPFVASKSSATNSTAAAPAQKPSKSRKLSFKEQKELSGIEDAIHTAEGRAAEIEAILHDPAFYATRSKEAPALTASLETAKSEVARLYARWEELEQFNK
ncbi:MAG TPA: ABC transporter ATP-binding protein, partial [Roseimicrobium sp.]|nr:ABC transporter ATP-binding protein [Roseimicrobium sp.]